MEEETFQIVSIPKKKHNTFESMYEGTKKKIIKELLTKINNSNIINGK